MQPSSVSRRVILSALLPALCLGAATPSAAAAAPATRTQTAAVAPAALAAGVPATWQTVGALAGARALARSVVLGDGSVLVAGGTTGAAYLKTAERWSPTTGLWTGAGAVGHNAAGQVAAPLPGGKALFAGGADGTSYYPYGDVYDPGTGAWTHTARIAHPHAYGEAATLANGDVLLVSGYDAGVTSPAVDIYRAASGTWATAAALPDGKGRYALSATSLADGRVLVTGGDDGTLSSGSTLATTYIYNTSSGWAAAESMKTPRFDHAAIRMADGRVLVAGGYANGVALTSTEVYDPATTHWTTAGNLVFATYGLTLSLLPDGRILAVGGKGSESSPALTYAQVYDPKTAGWSFAGSLATGRRYHTAATVSGGRVLVAGGYGAAAALTSSELFTPGPGTRFAGPDRYSTAASVSRGMFAPGVKIAYVANGETFPDSLAGAAAAGFSGGPLLLVNATLPAVTAAELSRLKPQKIAVLGGAGAVSEAIKTSLTKYSASVVRLDATGYYPTYPNDRFATAAAISKATFPAGVPAAFVASGLNFPDGLSGGPAAAHADGPLLLVGTSLAPVTAAELTRLKPQRIYVLGGTGSVNDAVKTALVPYAVGGTVTRLDATGFYPTYPNDRYATAAAISKASFTAGVPVAFVANGTTFPDGLAGGAAAGTKGGPLLLVSTSLPAVTAAELTRLKPKSIVVLGGEGAIPSSVFNSLQRYVVLP